MNRIYNQGLAQSTILIAGVVLLVLIGFVYYQNTGDTEPSASHNDSMTENKSDDAMTEKGEDGAMTEGNKDGDNMMEEKNGEAMVKGYTGEVLAGDTAPLINFNRADYEQALTEDKLVVLYFYANWCPICRVEVKNALYPAFNELDTDKVVGFRVNYKDSNTEPSEEDLAKEFGVGYQHTKVFLKDGQRILKAPDGWDKDRYLEEINKAL